VIGAGVLEWGAVSGSNRRRAVAVAGHTGDVDLARAALLDADPGVRCVAIGAMVRLGALGVDELRAALGDVDAAVRRRAAEEAAGAGLDVGAELVALLGDDDAGVAESAAFALGELRPTPAGVVDALVAATSHAEVLVREAAVAALGGIGDPAGAGAVLRACDDVATVRRRAVLALAAFEGEDVEAALARLATDRDRQVRQAAEDLLHGWGTNPETGGG
jgi:HEAT repeat protein